MVCACKHIVCLRICSQPLAKQLATRASAAAAANQAGVAQACHVLELQACWGLAARILPGF
eukprot:1161905-Pelagomonas_calceolata.AAC.5